jgi:hypothetical protein
MKRLRECTLVLVCGLLAVAFSAPPAFAQANAVDLSGQVLDPQSAAVVGAKVTMKNLATGASRSQDSSAEGRYTFVGLPPGRYELSVESKGFAKMVNPELILTIGQAAEFDAHLTIQTGTQVVTVTDAAELVETRRTAVSETVDARQINNLPINGRNYVNFTLINSQAARDSAPSIGAAPTSGLNFGGQRARNNQVSVDGADAVDNSVNGIRSTVSQEAVQEFQLIISNYMPEFGRATGAVINIVTKGGGNDVHGDVFGFFRHKNLQARNPFSVQVDPVTGAQTAVKQAYTRAQYGATLGGPIKKDKTFYFLSFEGTRRHETGFTNIGANAGTGTGPFGLVSVPGAPFGLPAGVNLQLTPQQAAFVTNLAVLGAPGGPTLAGQIAVLAGSASSVGLNGIDFGAIATASGVPSLPGPRFPLPVDCGLLALPALVPCTAADLVTLPGSFVPLTKLEGNYPIKEATSLWSARFDQIWSSRNSTFVRVSASPSLVTGVQVNAQNQNFGQNAGTRTSLNQYRDVALVAQHVTSFSSSLVNEFRFQFARRGLHYGFSQLPGGDQVAVNITGFAFFGREPFSTVDRIERRWQWTDNLTWVKGKHSFKFGEDTNLVQVRTSKQQTFELDFGGLYNFGSLSASSLGFPSTFAGVPVPSLSAVQAYGLGLPVNLLQGIGAAKQPFDNPTFGVFAQDSWRISPRFTLNYGVRYDIEFTPIFTPVGNFNPAAEKAFHIVEGLPRYDKAVSPRIGVAWDPWGDGKTVVRAGYGIYYDHPLLALAFDSTTADGARSTQLVGVGATPTYASPALNPAALNASTTFQGILCQIPVPGTLCTIAFPGPFTLGYLPSQQRFDPFDPTSILANQNFLKAGFPAPILPFTLPTAANFQYAYSQQANLTVERNLGKDFKLSAAYTLTRGTHLYRPRNVNASNPVTMVSNFANATASGLSFSSPITVQVPATGPAAACPAPVVAAFPAGTAFINTATGSAALIAPGALASGFTAPNCGGANVGFFSTAAIFNFFRPGGPNPSFAGLFPAGYGTATTVGSEVGLAAFAGYPTGFPGVQVPWSDVVQQESSGNSTYHALTVNLEKRFSHHVQFLASYTYSHAIDDSTDLQILLEPQNNARPDLERANSTFDQRHRFVFSGVLESPYRWKDSGFFAKLIADMTMAPIVEFSSGRPYTILTGTDYNFDFSSNTDRPSVIPRGVTIPPGLVTATSPFIHGVTFAVPTTCPTGLTPPFGCTGNLGRNAFYRPGFQSWDLRISRKIYLGERVNLEAMADAFNLFNKFNVADVNPLCDPATTCAAGQPAAALDPRIIQFGLKINF